jgi:hypothetical protein
MVSADPQKGRAMTGPLSKSVAIVAAAALAGAFGAAQAAPRPHQPHQSHPPPAAGGGYASPGLSAPTADPHVIYALEQLVTGQIPPELQAQMAPLHTLRDVEDLLKANNIAFKWGKAEIRSSILQPELLRQITALPPGEVFVVPQGSPPGQTMTFNVILGTRPE